MQGFLNKAATIIAKTEAISPTTQKYIPSMAESANMLGLGGGGGGNYDDYTSEPQYQQYPQQQQQQQYQQYPQQQYEPQYQQQSGGYSSAAKKLPSSIYESIASNPIEEYQGGGNMGGLSVLDSIMPPPQQRQQQQRLPQQRVDDYEYGEKPMPDMLDRVRTLKEQKGLSQQEYQQPQYQTQQTGGIDYSLIKMMIKDAIEEQFASLKKTMINESRQNSGAANSMVIKVGSDIKFMTNKGDVYSGSLTHVGKAKV